MCKNHKCANNHICANISPSNVQATTFAQTRRPQMGKSAKIHQPLMCKHDAVKGSILTWNVQILVFIKNEPHCANNHICANISPSNVQATTFAQTRRRQMCKSVKIHQPLMCKQDAVKTHYFHQARRNTLSFGGAKPRKGQICLRSSARGVGGGYPPSHGRDFFKNESIKVAFVEHLKQFSRELNIVKIHCEELS